MIWALGSLTEVLWRFRSLGFEGSGSCDLEVVVKREGFRCQAF